MLSDDRGRPLRPSHLPGPAVPDPAAPRRGGRTSSLERAADAAAELARVGAIAPEDARRGYEYAAARQSFMLPPGWSL